MNWAHMLQFHFLSLLENPLQSTAHNQKYKVIKVTKSDVLQNDASLFVKIPADHSLLWVQSE